MSNFQPPEQHLRTMLWLPGIATTIWEKPTMTTCVSSGLWPPITAVILKTLEHDTKYYYMYEKYTEVLPEKRGSFGKLFYQDFLLVWPWLCFAFYPRTFLCPGVFQDDEINWFGKCDHSY